MTPALLHPGLSTHGAKSLSLAVLISCGRTQPRCEPEYITLGLIPALQHSHV